MAASANPSTILLPARARGLWTYAALGIAALLIIAALWIWRSGQPREQLSSGTEPPIASGKGAYGRSIRASVETAAMIRAPRWLEVTGTVRAELESPVASKIMGRVQSVLVREGDRVSRGQPLVVLDSRDLDASIAQADANVRVAGAGYENARVAARMETSLSSARIGEAQAKVTQAEAAVKAATAKLDLVQAGPRPQERQQAVLAVSQARANLTLAENNLKRMDDLLREGAISAQQHDQYRAQLDVAKTQYDTARQGQSIADEGSRVEEIRAAQEAERQANAALAEARAGLRQAQAAALQVDVRKQEVAGAQAQIGQSQAGLRMAEVTRGYAAIASPFDGVVTSRLVDPGVMASPGVPLLKVQGGPLRLEAVVPESALEYARRGAPAVVRLDALGGRKVTGRVVEIAPQGDASSHTFIVKVELPRDGGVAAGMFGRARFATGTDTRLLVQATAVVDREGLRYLFVVDDSQVARLRMVTVGDPEGGRIPVLSGLSEGERVVVDGSQVHDGDRIESGRK